MITEIRVVGPTKFGSTGAAGMTGKEEIGTLAALNVQPGDVVEYVSGASMPYHWRVKGVHWTVADEAGRRVARYRDGGGGFNFVKGTHWIYRIVSRAEPAVTESEGPVRIVTRPEIVPGRYGDLDIYAAKAGCVGLSLNVLAMTAPELRAVIATLTQVAGVLEESK